MLLKLGGLWTIVWFLAIAMAKVSLTTGLFSQTPHPLENQSIWVGQKIFSMIQSLVVGPLGVASLWFHFSELWSLKQILLHPSWFHTLGEDGTPYHVCHLAEMGGDLFLAAQVTNVLLLILYRSWTPLNYLHHAIFIAVSLIIRGNCFFAGYAAVLLSQELSTVFLNFWLLFRHRLGNSHTLIKLDFAAFSVAFFIFRGCIATFCTFHFLYFALLRSGGSLVDFAKVPEWQVYTLAGMLCLGSLLQLQWGWVITKKMIKLISETFIKGKKNA